MLFVQKRTAEADDDMRAMTVKLIDRTLAIGGSYYLPYRLHATREQLRAAYPRSTSSSRPSGVTIRNCGFVTRYGTRYFA